jgi:hypothetical protein
MMHIHMKKSHKIRLISISVFVGLVACSPRLVVPVMWQQQAANVATADAWADPAGFDKETALQYVISNDSQNLYVLLKTDDPVTQMKILRAGMELAIDTLGRKKGHVIVSFPRPLAVGAMLEGVPRGERSRTGQPADRIDMYRNILARHDRMVLSGFPNHPNGQLPLLNEGGICVGVEIDSTGLMSYRAILPLSSFYREGIGEEDTRRRFGLLVTVKGLSMTPGAAGGMQEGSRQGGDMGMPGGRRPMPGTSPGGRDPGARSGMMAGGDINSLTQDKNLQMQFSLRLE